MGKGLRVVLVIATAVAMLVAVGPAAAGKCKVRNGCTTSPTPTPAPAPAPTGTKSTTLPPGSPILSDAAAASHVVRSSFEPRPQNATANARVPSSSELSTYLTAAAGENLGNCNSYKSQVTGNFTGTTDEIIQWAAWKWGLDEDVLRAVAVEESNWYMSAAGDGGVSYGLMQIKSTVHLGTAPLSQQSTAFNADYYAMYIRYYYDGCAGWLDTVDHVGTYAAGDLWGSVGAWYAGRWHTTAAESYISAVKSILAARTWAQSGF